MRTKYGKMLRISDSCEDTRCSLYGSCNLFEELELLEGIQMPFPA